MFASLDGYFTLQDIDGDISLEGNPVMHYLMSVFSPRGGLVIGKGAVLAIVLAFAFVTTRGIKNNSGWAYRFALTRYTCNYMKSGKRYWVAHVPLYLTAFMQGMAATVWMTLIN